MRTIKTNFKRSGKYFVVAMLHLFEALAMIIVATVVLAYYAMNGQFVYRRLRKPYVYVWRAITWGALVWATFTYVLVPFFAWWDKAMEFIGNVIFG